MAHAKIKTTMVHEWTRRWWSFLQTLNSCRSLGYARGHESVRVFNDLCKPIEICIYDRKKHPFASHPAAKHPNAANSGLQTCDKSQWTYLLTSQGGHFIPHNNFANFGSFAKVPVPVTTIIPCLAQGIINMNISFISYVHIYNSLLSWA